MRLLAVNLARTGRAGEVSITEVSITEVSITEVSITEVSITEVSITEVSITEVSITDGQRNTGKDRPDQAGKDAEHTNSSYAIPEDMSAALQKLIVDRLMKVSRAVRRLETDAEEGLGAAVGWEDMPAAAREFHARSAQDIADEDLGVAVTDD